LVACERKLVEILLEAFRHMDNFNVYYAKSREAWFCKWKEGAEWKLKAVPKEIQSEQQARLWSATFMRNSSIVPPKPRPTFCDVAALWLASKEELFKDDNKSLSGSRRFKNHWLGALAPVVVEDCTVAMASEWVEWVKKETKASYTARNVLQAMRNFVVEARGRGWVELKENVFLDPWIRKVLGTPRPKAGAGVIVRLDPEHVRKLLNSELLTSHRRLLYILAITSGLRAGELAALTAADVIDGCLSVTKQVTNGMLKPPKKGSSRLVPLCSSALAVTQCRDQKVAHFGIGGVRRPIVSVCTSKELRDDLNRLGLPSTMKGHPITFHALRRTCLTMLRASGTPLEDIASIAGHSGLSVTDACYAAPDIARLREHVERTFGLFIQCKNPQN
jgi:integrase